MNKNMIYFNAMKIFLDSYWEIGDRKSEDLASLLSSLEADSENGLPRDMALWEDWLSAVDQATSS